MSGFSSMNILEKRSRRLVELAIGRNEREQSFEGSSSTNTSFIRAQENCKKITVIQEQTSVLDDKTGRFIFHDCSSVDLKPNNDQLCQQSCSLDNVILDEKTGQITQDNSKLLSTTELFSSDLDFSESESEYVPSNHGNSSSSDIEHFRILDEFSGAIKVKRARKGQGNKKNWTRNVLKHKRMKGQEYVSIKRKKNEGIVGVENRKGRELQDRCDSEKCAKRFAKKCNKISNYDRKVIFDTFWQLSWEERKAFVVAMVSLKQVTAQTKGHPSRRTNTLQYTLKVGGEIVPVCKKMFCGTLSLGEWSVANWVKGEKSNNEIGMPKKNQPAKRLKAINTTKVQHISNFLTALPKMPSHYCRQSTAKDYVDINYTTWAEVYYDFEKYLKDQSIPDGEKPTYKCFLDIIHKNNLSIYRPKKDQCDLCYAYKNKNLPEEDYNNHITARDRARKEKAEDKERCLNGEIQMVTVDLQAVQSIPLISAGAQYFKLKLSVHQFTIYNEYDKSVVCYVWHEGEGGMEANVFASCLLDYLQRLDKTKPMVIYSDGCSAQNRNVTLSNALQHFAVTHNAEIQQKYLVVGHTQMECDSVHATIERKKKGKELFVPADFATIIKQARLSKPYEVRYLNHNFFSDFSSLQYLKSIRPGSKKGDPCVVDLKALKYTSASDTTGAHYKLCFDEDWRFLPHRMTRQLNVNRDLIIPALYNQPLSITKRKYDDLQDMKQLIPADYHSFYDNLVHE